MKKFAIALSLLLVLGLASAVSAQQITDNFFVTVGSGTVLEGGGTGFNNGEWYVYPSMWINQWFYDHPFDPTRGKIIHIEFDWTSVDPECTVDIEVAVNWSTPAYSDLGLGDTEPPLPGCDEELYIIREPFLDVCEMVTDVRHEVFDFIIYDYNPEWVSIDVRGCNFEIMNGVIVHECAVGTESTTWGAIKSIMK